MVIVLLQSSAIYKLWKIFHFKIYICGLLLPLESPILLWSARIYSSYSLFFNAISLDFGGHMEEIGPHIPAYNLSRNSEILP